MRDQQSGDEAPVVLRDPAGQLTVGQVLTLPLELGRHDEVDPVGLPADMVIDPRQFLVELLRSERGRAEHSESARIGHCADDVAAVTEGEKGEIGTELVTDG